jgi:hypothetical protein
MSRGSVMTRGIPAAVASLLAAATALVGALPAPAQTNTGTTFGAFLQIEPVARTAAMGNAGVSAYDGLAGVYFNPASIGHIPGYEVICSHSAWFAGISHDFVAVGIPLGGIGNMYTTITSLNSGDMDVRTVDQPLGTGERFSVRDLALGVGYGRQFSPRFSAGAQLNFVQETIYHTAASTLTMSVGTLYRVSENGLRIGSSLSNFGTRASFNGRDLRFNYDNVPGLNGDNSSLPATRFTDPYSVPVAFRVGLAMPFRFKDEQRLLVEVDAFHPNDNSESMSVGAEYSVDDAIALRGGYQDMFQQDSEVGLTLGSGIKGRVDSYKYQVDYAWADQGRLGHSHRVTVGISF